MPRYPLLCHVCSAGGEAAEFDAKLSYLLAMYDTMTVGKTMIFVAVSGALCWSKSCGLIPVK